MLQDRLRFRLRTAFVAVGILALVFAGVWEYGRLRERIRKERASRVLAAIHRIERLAGRGRLRPEDVSEAIGLPLVATSRDDEGWQSWRSKPGGSDLFTEVELRTPRYSPEGAGTRLVLHVRPWAMPTRGEIQFRFGNEDIFENVHEVKIESIGYHGNSLTHREFWGDMEFLIAFPDRRGRLTKAVLSMERH